jgi:hypothetical protein
MYPIKFHSIDSTNLHTSSQILECKRFSERLLHTPSDKHLYDLRMFLNPLRYPFFSLDIQFSLLRVFTLYFKNILILSPSPGRLPGPVKDLYKYVRLDFFLNLYLKN